MNPPDDPIYREMLPEFVATWKVDTESLLADVITAKDSKELYRFGHTLVGSGLQFGFESLAPIGRALEECSRTEEWTKAAALRVDLLGELDLIAQLIGTP